MKLGKILGAALPLAAMFIPGVGPAISAALMGAGLPAGLAAAAGSSIGVGALTGGLGAALGGHNVLKGAALGGLGGAIGPAISGAFGAAPAAGAAAAGAGGAGLGSTIAATTPGLVEGAGAAANSTAGALASEAAQTGVKNLPAQAALQVGKHNILPMLALGGLGLAMAAPKPKFAAEEENKNPNAGKEVQDPRIIHRPPADYGFGGSNGEWMFFDPSATTGTYHYRDGGAVQTEPQVALYDPSKFAGLFERPQITNPTGPVAAFGDAGPATMHWTPPPPKPTPPVAPPPAAAQPTVPTVNPQVPTDLSKVVSEYFAAHPYSGVDYMNGIQFSRGGHVKGPGTSTSDSIPAIMPNGGPAKLSDGEYILPAHVVSKIGGGSNKRGANHLDAMVRGLGRK